MSLFTRLCVFCLSLAVVPMASAAMVTIDFESLPTGGVPVSNTAVGTSYATWGVSDCWSTVINYPRFRSNIYNNPGMFILGGSAAYQRTYMYLQFAFPVDEIICDVATAPGSRIYGQAYNANGDSVGFWGGADSGGAPGSFWIRDFTMTPTEPIVRLNLYTGNSGVIFALDNLRLVPEPASVILLAVAGMLLRRKRQ